MDSEFGRFDFSAYERSDKTTRGVRKQAPVQGARGSASSTNVPGIEPFAEVGAIGAEAVRDQQHNDDLASRMVRLEAAHFEDERAPLADASKRGLVYFMRTHAQCEIPLLGAESTGNIVATWVRGDECLSLRFVDRYRFHFALTARQGDVLHRTWGDGHVLTFFSHKPDARRLVSPD